MKLTLILLLTIFVGCKWGDINTPEQLESAVYAHTTYNTQFLHCQERAKITERWFYEHGYKIKTCVENFGYGKHVFVKWTKDGKEGEIFRHDPPGHIEVCTFKD